MKENTHIVIKRDDLEYLSEITKSILKDILFQISVGREKDGKNPTNSYYICNTDEPYADKVLRVILEGEYCK